MPDAAERFIQAAISPMEDNAELTIAARHQLEEAIRNAAPGPGDTRDIAAATLEQRDRPGFLKRWKAALYLLTAGVSAAVLGLTAASVISMWPAYQLLANTLSIRSFYIDPAMSDRMLAGHLKPKERLLLLGDTAKAGRAARIKGLWDSEPDNAAYFADYAIAHLSDHSALPLDFLETARKLDPDNGWFIAIAAGESARQAIDPGSRATTTSPGGVKLKLIKDAAKRDEALALLHEASAKPRFDSYQPAMLRKRIPLLPARTDTTDQFVPFSYLAGTSAPNFRIRYLGDVMAIQAMDLAKAGDRVGFRQLRRDWDLLTGNMIRAESIGVIDMLLATSNIRVSLKAMHEAAVDLGLSEEAARLKALDDRFEERKRVQTSRPDPLPELQKHGSVLGGASWPMLSKQTLRTVEIPAEELQAGRLADHAFAGRVLALAAWIVLALAMNAAGLYSYRGSALPRRLSVRLGELLKVSDHARIIGIGIMLPALYYLVIYRLTPWGGRDWSLAASAYIVPAAQFGTMLSLMLVLPVLITRARLNRRAGAAGLRARQTWVPWAAVACAAAALPTFGLSLEKGSNAGIVMNIATGLIGILLLYALIAGIRALFSRQQSLLRRMTLARAVIPAYAAGMVLMMLAMPLYHLEEKHWFGQDEISRFSAENPSFSRYEWDVTQVLREELLEIIETKP
ncbi:hypothetical protein [Luteolibacter sp. Populi]|uniref:hypothetical protein n=1 Tax=Luteolibacter sp. Populi TaxID=3230487 RepID=UPI003465A306